MQWINVKDRLPEKEGLYLCYHRAWITDVIEFYNGEFREIGLGDDKPTHWMPLPELPEEGNNAELV